MTWKIGSVISDDDKNWEQISSYINMAFLARAWKSDLLNLIDELELTPSENPKVAQIIKIIIESKDFNK